MFFFETSKKIPATGPKHVNNRRRPYNQDNISVDNGIQVENPSNIHVTLAIWQNYYRHRIQEIVQVNDC